MVRATAPVRVCDVGGWTDTWFGQPGLVVNVAVGPGAEVTVAPAPGPDPVVLDVASFGDRYPVEPGSRRAPGRHPLLEAALDALPPPSGRTVEVTVRAHVPPGSGTGASAAVAVALIGALAALRGEAIVPREAAYLAHQLEVVVCGQESGIQDQLAAALGGFNYLRIDPYPEAQVEALSQWDEIGPCLSVIYLGYPHDSYALHRQVIQDANERGPGVFDRLREAAAAAREAIVEQDIVAFGRALEAGTDAIGSLHRDLVGPDARRVIELARASSALGWKVNGAGGEGGSLAVLSRSALHRQEFEAAVVALSPLYQVLPMQLSPAGLQVTSSL